MALQDPVSLTLVTSPIQPPWTVEIRRNGSVSTMPWEDVSRLTGWDR